MNKILAFTFCLIGWFAIIAQYYLLLETKTVSFMEATIRFFSFFTILTNIMVAAYFTKRAFKNPFPQNESPGTLTAISVYIVIVGVVYQLVLRSTWSPTGLQKIVDELLHSAIPVLVLIYWYFYENKYSLHYNLIPKWSVYPLLYLFFILIRGHFSGFYPYPFINVSELGILHVLANAILVLIFFIGLSMLLIRLGKTIAR
ncbi:Pr6Pr family membrane protein [Chryseobacterium sp. Alg-005]|uniref:Pr6Pr family membrane protein n=1 Tax=Chryseobacterium sp. Alg-005 TaxID=3159516 RepID=UPI003555890C